jgi:hypothetical protein
MFQGELLTPRPYPSCKNPLSIVRDFLFSIFCSYPPHIKALTIGLINMGTKLGLIQREELGPRVFENRVLREMLGRT